MYGFWGCQTAVTNCHLHKRNPGTQQIKLHFFLAIIIHSQSAELLLVFHVQIKPWGEDPWIRIVGQYIKQRKQHAVSVLLKWLIITPAPTFTKWDLAWGYILNMHIKANEKINLESQIGQICMLELLHFQVDAHKWWLIFLYPCTFILAILKTFLTLYKKVDFFLLQPCTM